MPGRRSLPLACGALVVATQLTATTPAQAEDGDACHTESRAWRYVVVFDPGTAGSAARDAVGAACGRLTGYFPEIAVAVATSTHPGFTTALGPDRAFSAERARHLREQGSPTAATETPSSRYEPRATAGDGDTATSSDSRVGSARARDRTAEQWPLRMSGAPDTSGDLTHSAQADLAAVTVCVLDSGVDATHPDLTGAVNPAASAGCVRGVAERHRSAWSPSASAHGTHVAGIIGAAADGHGITGTAPGVRLASVRIVDDEGYATPEAAVCGYMWAARHSMAVANSSVTVAPSGVSCAARNGRRVVHESVSRAVEFAERSGTLTVAAATNDGFELGPLPRSELRSGETGDLARQCVAVPAGLRETVTVSAVDRHGVKTDYSSYGREVVGLAAPGGSGGDCVLSTVPGGHGHKCGTSMAAPHVSGAAALLASGSDERSPSALRRMLHRQARPIACSDTAREDDACTGPRGDNTYYGSGMVDLRAAYSAHTVHRPEGAH